MNQEEINGTAGLSKVAIETRMPRNPADGVRYAGNERPMGN
ncbi:MAG: hypothetical protein WBA20_08590 [Ketobacter sp.]